MGDRPRSPDSRSGAEARGRAAEAAAAAVLTAEGWTLRDHRRRTPAGEIDMVASRNGVIAFIEVKARRTLSEAAFSLSARQRERLLAAGEWWLAQHPGEGAEGVRFDVILVDTSGRIRRIADAFRVGD